MPAKVVTRFAPSPTGFLHLGSARTALYSWLHARQHNGLFILRIEDTDLERSTKEAVAAILKGMQWLGLDWDKGPYYQTERFERYQEVIQQLLQQGDAYRCICTKERLEQLRNDQMAAKEKPRYDGHCREKSFDKTAIPFVIRFKNPQEGVVVVEDRVHGQVTFQNSELDDLIIARSDGVPTYNLCVVVDDGDMGVTEVIRGDDHLNNTPRQMNILKALGFPSPVYAHIPMILGADGKRLSKRQGAVSVQDYQREGVLPQALLNYLVRLGWSHGDQEIFSMRALLEHFSIDRLSRSASALNPEKLLWLNQQYCKLLPIAEVLPHVVWQCSALGLETKNGPDLKEVVLLQVDRCKTIKELVEKSFFFYQEPMLDEALLAKHFKEAVLPALQSLQSALTALETWESTAIHACLERVAMAFDRGLGALAQPLRVAMSGGTVSPSIDRTLAVLGKACVLRRFQRALDKVPVGL